VIALDLSRLLSRAGSATPSGIDRVELAYARHLSADGAAYCFAARNALGGIGLLPKDAAGDFVDRLVALWRDGATAGERRRIAALARWLRLAALTGTTGLRKALRVSSFPAVYLIVSHQNLDRPRPIARLKAATGARFVCLIHDLIPLDCPELTRPAQTARHGRRIAAVAALADAAIVNSAATGDALCPRLGSRRVPIAIAPLGIDLRRATPAAPSAAPYFICIGTIERRKNHELLLSVWQRLAAELAAQTPRLLLIGQRGLGGQQMTERLGALRGVVSEHSDMPDAAMAKLLGGARALLLPSLAEGFGLPVAEALSLGVPVVCSDLPALRESGGGVPDYLDPHDATAWRAAILDFATDSPRQRAQLARLSQWRPSTWREHFAIVERLIRAL
jgi:glycosyltransferase involved in cell wall biosynthesis